MLMFVGHDCKESEYSHLKRESRIKLGVLDGAGATVRLQETSNPSIHISLREPLSSTYKRTQGNTQEPKNSCPNS